MSAAVEPVAAPLVDALETADGAITERRGFLLRVRDGVTALGEATPLPGWTESHEACRTALDDAAADLDSGFDAALAATAGAPAARHAVALARADRSARRDGRPLADALGGDAADAVPVNATVGDADATTTAERVAAAVDAGYDCVKVKVGARSLDRDAARLRAARTAAPDATLRADANGAWDRETARAALDVLASLDVAYVEQPLPADDLDGLASLRGGPVGVAVDESLAATPAERVLDAGAADVLVLKPMVLGGPDRAREAALAARRRGATAVVTTTIDFLVARLGALHVAASLGDVSPCGLATAGALAADLGPDPAPVADGRMAVPDGPGLGVDPAEVGAP